MNNLSKVIISVGVCELVGIISTPFTIAAIPTWYTTLIKPSFSPPNWVFAPVWTTLYFFMGISFYLIWKQGWKKRTVQTAGVFFLAQLTVNFLWSLLFFAFRSPLLGLIDIVALWILIVITMIRFYPFSKKAFYLLIPYLLWVSFAIILNAAIVLLN